MDRGRPAHIHKPDRLDHDKAVAFDGPAVGLNLPGQAGTIIAGLLGSRDAE